MQMHALVTTHVVRFTWINEEVGMRASLYTFGNERQAMLWNDSLVVVACDDLQLSFQVCSLA